jgi:ABC-type dipeptide/oligopeptide/nickel transport system permease component
MLRYFIRRLLYAVPILVGVSLVTFVLFYVTVNPVQMAKRNLSAKNPTPEQVHDWLVAHGYDKPLPVQFRKHMSELFLLRGRRPLDIHRLSGLCRIAAGLTLLRALDRLSARHLCG